MNVVRQTVWTMSWPLRWYVNHCPFPRGKGIIVDYLLKPILPGLPAAFEAALPGGGIVNLRYREKIGFSTFLKGVFERNELEYVRSVLRPGDLAIDVGANIGIYTVAMGLAVQEGGNVWAFEPLPENVVRLKQNLLANRVEYVDVCEMALSDSDGQVNLYLAGDSAYPSTVAVREGFADGKQLLVESGRLDKRWQDAGEPVVRLIKIDVEGAEPKVLRGAEQCLRKCKPVLLLEANEADDLEEIKTLLEPLGYEGSQPEGFHGWNWLFRVPE